MADASKTNNSPAAGHGAASGREIRNSMSAGRVLLLLISVVWGGLAIPCRAQEKEKPLFLVARPTIEDPFFEKSVVLMVPLGEDQVVVGIVVNKPTRLPLSQLFSKNPTLKNRSELVYLGGPVDMSVPALIFHSAKPPKEAIPIYGDVYLSFDGKVIQKELEDPKPAGEMRVFMGRAQWAPMQLDGEALDGSWYSLRGEADVIFDHDSEHLWNRLHDRARPSEHIKYRMPDRSLGPMRILPAEFRRLLMPHFPALGFGSS